ncbi:hypothetical protein BT69DRAFT_452107 [Atractiella rhizophila]|nr:hypothetical protein BT69DRAFT_452107 [Atractiella rhizophila]
MVEMMGPIMKEDDMFAAKEGISTENPAIHLPESQHVSLHERTVLLLSTTGDSLHLASLCSYFSTATHTIPYRWSPVSEEGEEEEVLLTACSLPQSSITFLSLPIPMPILSTSAFENYIRRVVLPLATPFQDEYCRGHSATSRWAPDVVVFSSTDQDITSLSSTDLSPSQFRQLLQEGDISRMYSTNLLSHFWGMSSSYLGHSMSLPPDKMEVYRIALTRAFQVLMETFSTSAIAFNLTPRQPLNSIMKEEEEEATWSTVLRSHMMRNVERYVCQGLSLDRGTECFDVGGMMEGYGGTFSRGSFNPEGVLLLQKVLEVLGRRGEGNINHEK